MNRWHVIRWNGLWRRWLNMVGMLAAILLIATACVTPVPKATPELVSSATPASLQPSPKAMAELPHGALVAELELLSAPATADDVRVRFTLTNMSDTPLYVLTWYTPLEGIAGEIFRVKRDGRVLPYEGLQAVRDVPTLEQYILLEPQESAAAEVNLADVYDFTQAGEYRIAFLSPKISRIARSEDEIAQAVEELVPVEMPANTIRMLMMPALDYEVQRSTNEAAQMIYQALLREHPDLNVALPLAVEELPLPGLWELLGVQLFRITDGPQARESFLINRDLVLQLGTAVGGRGLTSAEVGDIDGDGRAELLFTYSFGSGMHQSHLGTYAPAVDRERVFELNRAFLGDWGLFIDEAGEICVRAVEAHEETLSIAFLDTLGCLSMKTVDGEVDLELNLDPALPDDVREKVIHTG